VRNANEGQPVIWKTSPEANDAKEENQIMVKEENLQIAKG